MNLPPYIYGREAAPNEKVWTEASVRAALAAQPGAVGGPVLNLTLTRTEVEYIAAFVSAEDNEPNDDVVTLMVGGGHSGYGLYATHPEYPEEGAVFVRTLAPTEAKPAQDAVDAARWRFISDRYRVAFENGQITSLNSVVSEQWRRDINASVDRMMAGDWSDV